MNMYIFKFKIHNRKSLLCKFCNAWIQVLGFSKIHPFLNSVVQGSVATVHLLFIITWSADFPTCSSVHQSLCYSQRLIVTTEISQTLFQCLSVMIHCIFTCYSCHTQATKCVFVISSPSSKDQHCVSFYKNGWSEGTG